MQSPPIGHQYCIAAKPAPGRYVVQEPLTSFSAESRPRELHAAVPDRLSTNTVVHMLSLN